MSSVVVTLISVRVLSRSSLASRLLMAVVMAASLRTCSGSKPNVLQPARATAIAAITAMLMIRRVMVSSAGRTMDRVPQEACPHARPVGALQERVGEGAGAGRGRACATVDLA